jgi:hypothetical protein
MDSQNRYVQSYAGIALARINETRALAPLIRALKDNDNEVRSKAISALEGINDSQVSHGKPRKNKSRRRLSTSLRWPFLADLDPRNVSDLTHKGILPAALFQVIKGIHRSL